MYSLPVKGLGSGVQLSTDLVSIVPSQSRLGTVDGLSGNCYYCLNCNGRTFQTDRERLGCMLMQNSFGKFLARWIKGRQLS